MKFCGQEFSQCEQAQDQQDQEKKKNFLEKWEFKELQLKNNMKKSAELAKIAQDAIAALEESSVLKKTSIEVVKRALRNMDIFTQMSTRRDFEEFLSAAIDRISYRAFKAGTPIYQETQFGNRVYFILGGKVSLIEKKSPGDAEREENMLAHSPTRKKQKEAEALDFQEQIKPSQDKSFHGDISFRSKRSTLSLDRNGSLSLKNGFSLGKYESFGNVSKESTPYRNSAIAEIDTQLCFLTPSELDTRFSDILGGIGVVTEQMEKIFPQLRYEQVKRICYVPECKIWTKGDNLYKEGGPITHYFVLKSGCVHIYKYNVQQLLKAQPVSAQTRKPLPDQFLVRVIKAGDIFGLEDMFLTGQRYFTAHCTTPLTEVYEVKAGHQMSGLPWDAETLRELRKKCKDLLGITLSLMIKHLDDANYKLILTSSDVEAECAAREGKEYRNLPSLSLQLQQVIQDPLKASQMLQEQQSPPAPYHRKSSLTSRRLQPELSIIKEVPLKKKQSDKERAPSEGKLSKIPNLPLILTPDSSPLLKIKFSAPYLNKSVSNQSINNSIINASEQVILNCSIPNSFQSRQINLNEKPVRRRANQSLHTGSSVQQSYIASAPNGQLRSTNSYPLQILQKKNSLDHILPLSPLTKKRSMQINLEEQSPKKQLLKSEPNIKLSSKEPSSPVMSRQQLSPKLKGQSGILPKSARQLINLTSTLDNPSNFEMKPLYLQHSSLSKDNQDNFTKLRNPSQNVLSKPINFQKGQKEMGY